ncbi:MAG: NAD(P)(+) transhydrogenase (Re/Si-specific) subunit beta [Rhodothermaceae bacterium]|nr:NAD(P)(+) transhydrogenase (Re/Si-specific) subunit beta [Rhodothermaceae bacterium]
MKNPLIPSGFEDLTILLIQLVYLLAVGMFILGLKRLSSPATAVSGNRMASLAMFIAVIVTLFDQQILAFEYIIAGVIVGSLIGAVLAKKVEMTSMPELVAVFNGFGGGASALVASAEYIRVPETGMLFADIPVNVLVTMSISVFIGSITFTGSLIAFGKLKGILSGNPLLFKGQKIINALLAIGVAVATVMLVLDPANWIIYASIGGVSLILGILFVLPIGGADMPVVIALLNSFSGVAASAAGFVIDNNILIVAGALVGASGLILTMIMCKAMNRSLTHVLFGGFGQESTGLAMTSSDSSKTVREVSADDLAMMTAYAKRVIIVPGYQLEKRNVDVKYGIHPVAGRMPGHMNVLLAEANVPYPQLADMDEINPDFPKTDVVLVIGANDVVNPDARTNPASPIYGMPILNVDEARAVVVFKRSLNPGFAGIDNQLFYNDNSYMFFGDAKKSLSSLLEALKEID